MSKRNKPANAGSAKAATGSPADDQPKAANAETAAADGEAPTPATGGGSGGDGAAGADTQAVNLTVLDPDGNPSDLSAVPGDGYCERHQAANGVEPNIMAAMYAAVSLHFPNSAGGDEEFEADVRRSGALAEFFRTFPESPDEAGLTQLQRLKIELPEEHRPGLLLAMIRVFRVALDQLDRLDREDAARAEAAKPKPKPEQWREPKGFKQTKKAMQPGSGLKPRR